MVRNNPFNIQLPGLSENRVPQDLMDYQFIQLAAIFFIQVYGCLSIPTTSRVFCMGQPQVGPGKRGLESTQNHPGRWSLGVSPMVMVKWAQFSRNTHFFPGYACCIPICIWLFLWIRHNSQTKISIFFETLDTACWCSPLGRWIRSRSPELGSPTGQRSRQFTEAELSSDCMLMKRVLGHLLHTISGWWFQPIWKILVSWGYYSQYMEK